jgi:hypothetical protein
VNKTVKKKKDPSGEERLILQVMSDIDPTGEERY